MYQTINRYKNLSELSIAAANKIRDYAIECVNSRGRFSIALSGGKTPDLLYNYLADSNIVSGFPWKNTFLFWGDERCVLPDDPQSNYCMAYNSLISKAPIPPENIFRILAEQEDSAKVSINYEQVLHDFFYVADDRANILFDLVLLGVGFDGHTASIFPNDRSFDEVKKLVMPSFAPDGMLPKNRITLTLPAVNISKRAYFIVSGTGKKNVIDTILNQPDYAYNVYPSARVKPLDGLIWFLDSSFV